MKRDRKSEYKKYYSKNPEKKEALRIRQRDYTNNTLSGRATTLLKAYRVSDKKRDRTFDLNKQWFIDNILKKECYYCGTKDQLGADRIDNTKGHMIDNIIPCCAVCNSVRSDIFSVEDMYYLGSFIRQMRTYRDIKKVSGNKLITDKK